MQLKRQSWRWWCATCCSHSCQSAAVLSPCCASRPISCICTGGKRLPVQQQLWVRLGCVGETVNKSQRDVSCVFSGAAKTSHMTLFIYRKKQLFGVNEVSVFGVWGVLIMCRVMTFDWPRRTFLHSSRRINRYCQATRVSGLQILAQVIRNTSV